jgi:3-keto-disaccharide hydrolase
MRIAPLLLFLAMFQTSKTDSWQPLFNGKDLSGWKHVGPGQMVVEDGLIRTEGGMGLLYWTGGKVGDSVIRVVFKMKDKNDNAGVFIRIPEEPTEQWMPVNRGFEVQIDNAADDYHTTGVLYSLTKAKARPGKSGPEWNTMEITLDGPRTTVTVNGVQVTDYTEGQPVPAKQKDFEPNRGPRPNEGYIGIQNHGEHDVVFFKEISLKRLR